VSAVTSRPSAVGQIGARLAALWRRGAGHFTRARLVSAGAGSDVGRVRASNEDYFLMADLTRPALAVRGSAHAAALTSSQALLVVADGMGGAAGGEVASAIAADVIGIAIENAVRDRRPRTAWQWRRTLGDAFAAANDRIQACGDDEPTLRGMGTTATAAVMSGDGLHLAHVGDSRAYLVRDGAARRLTRDHTWLQAALDDGRAHEIAGNDPRRNALLRALGTRPDVAVDTEHVVVQPGDTLILCTDGLWSVIDDDELARAVIAHAELGALCAALLALANERGGHDNATLVVARIDAAAER